MSCARLLRQRALALISWAGDIRSRLVRLIPACPPGSPLDAIRNLLSYRLPTMLTEREARDQWRDIVEGSSDLWNGIPGDRKETIRGAPLTGPLPCGMRLNHVRLPCLLRVGAAAPCAEEVQLRERQVGALTSRAAGASADIDR